MRPGLKEAIRAAMLTHLKTKGWPRTFNGDQIMHELPNLWMLLQSEGLLKELEAKGLTYKQFAGSAIKARHQQQMREEIAKRFGFRF